jgi:hypothetical protein
MIYIVLLLIWLMGVACGVGLAWLIGCSYCAAHPPTPEPVLDCDHHHDTAAFGPHDTTRREIDRKIKEAELDEARQRNRTEHMERLKAAIAKGDKAILAGALSLAGLRRNQSQRIIELVRMETRRACERKHGARAFNQPI